MWKPSRLYCIGKKSMNLKNKIHLENISNIADGLELKDSRVLLTGSTGTLGMYAAWVIEELNRRGAGNSPNLRQRLL